jgi:hypothetical protein
MTPGSTQQIKISALAATQPYLCCTEKALEAPLSAGELIVIMPQ